MIIPVAVGQFVKDFESPRSTQTKKSGDGFLPGPRGFTSVPRPIIPMPRKYIPYLPILHDAFGPAVFTDYCHKSLTYYNFTKGKIVI